MNQVVKFGCPRCKSANPTDEQLCPDCLRQKLLYLAQLSQNPRSPADDARAAGVAGGAQPVTPPPPATASQSIFSNPAVKRFTSPFWLMIFCFIIFYLYSGRQLMGRVQSNANRPVYETNDGNAKGRGAVDPRSPGAAPRAAPTRDVFSEHGL